MSASANTLCVVQTSEKVQSATEKKSENEVLNTSDEVHKMPKYDLRKFSLTRILNNNTVRKSIVLLGKFPDTCSESDAIVLFEKQAFQQNEVQTNCVNVSNDSEKQDDVKVNYCNGVSYFSKELDIKTEFINNIYGSYTCVPIGALNGIKTTVIYPATEKHIEKYSICQKYIIEETPTLYENITLPYIESSQFSLDWVYNILDHKQEVDRIVFEDNDLENGFILLPDMKWDGKNVDNLYLIAISHKHNIKSLRDLNADHLPLLRNIQTRSAEAIEKRYGLSVSQLRMYIHYQPSFYHLHVHINPVRNDAPGIWCEKSHMLSTVINNLELMSDYYKRATLPFVLYDGNKLLENFENVLTVRKTLNAKNDVVRKTPQKRTRNDVTVVESATSNVNENNHENETKRLKCATKEVIEEKEDDVNDDTEKTAE